MPRWSGSFNNSAKHAQASKVHIDAHIADGLLQMSISDDGVGGANPALGSGLTGLQDRVAALGGTIVVSSPPGLGTSLLVSLPVSQ